MGARGADKRDPRVLVSGGGAGGGCGGWCRFYRRARCGGQPQGHGTQQNQTQNGHFRRQIQSSLASERSILEPKGTKKHPQKNCQAFPLVLRVKNRTLRSASSQQKNDKSFPPSGVLKWPHSDRQATRKTPKTKIDKQFPFF